jgi:hypothetical protein
MKTNRTPLLLLFSLLIVVGCSSSSNVVSSAAPEVDFSQLKTFDFVRVADTDGQEYQSLVTTYLRNAVTRELTARGMTQNAQPDVMVNFSIETQEKVRSRSVPTGGYGVGYDPFYDAYYDGWGATHQTMIDQYTEGRLNIDLIDPAVRKMIWQGSTSGRLTKQDYENAEATLNGAVAEIFAAYPVPKPPAR